MPHIVAIGWLWVTFMMAITEKSVVAGVMTFVFYGLLPCGVLIYLISKSSGRRRSARLETEARMAQQDASPEPSQESEPKPPA
jgi:hypothetical protein